MLEMPKIWGKQKILSSLGTNWESKCFKQVDKNQEKCRWWKSKTKQKMHERLSRSDHVCGKRNRADILGSRLFIRAEKETNEVWGAAERVGERDVSDRVKQVTMGTDCKQSHLVAVWMRIVEGWEHRQKNVGVAKYRAGRHIRQLRLALSSTHREEEINQKETQAELMSDGRLAQTKKSSPEVVGFKTGSRWLQHAQKSCIWWLLP